MLQIEDYDLIFSLNNSDEIKINISGREDLLYKILNYNKKIEKFDHEILVNENDIIALPGINKQKKELDNKIYSYINDDNPTKFGGVYLSLNEKNELKKYIIIIISVIIVGQLIFWNFIKMLG